MFKTIGILILSLCLVISVSSETFSQARSSLTENNSLGWFNSLLQHIKRLQPHQVTIISDDTPNNYSTKKIYAEQKIMREFPSSMINLSRLIDAKDDRSLASPVYNNPRHVSLFVTFSTISEMAAYKSLNRLEQQFNVFIERSPKYARPKWLLVFLDSGNYLDIDDDFFRKICTNAWDKMFLDFSIIQEKYNDEVFLYHYNPFFSFLKKEPLTTEIHVFPDKLRNLNNFVITAETHVLPPFVTIEKRDGQISIQPNRKLTFIADKLNFQYDVALDKDDWRVSKKIILDKLNRNQINLYLNRMVLSSVRCPDGKCTINLLFAHGRDSYEKTVALVPVFFVKKLEIPKKTFVYIFLVPILVTVAAYILHKVGHRKGIPKFFNFVQILAGIVVGKELNDSTKNAFVVSILLSSIIYANELYSNFLNVQVIETEISYLNAQDLASSGLHFYGTPSSLDRLSQSIDPDVQKIAQNFVVHENIKNCILELVEKRNMICIMSLNRAERLMTSYFHENQISMVKVAEITLAYDVSVFLFETASPYIGKFDEIMQLIIESGMEKMLNPYELSEAPTSMEERQKKTRNDNIFLIEVCLIWLVGQLIALIVFVLELLHSFFSKKRNNK